MKRVFTCIWIFVTVCQFCWSQGYSIEIEIEGLKGNTLILGHYFNGNTYTEDTAIVQSPGKYVFKDDHYLDPGMYFLLLDNNWLFDIVVGEDQSFSLSTKSPDLAENMQVDGDLDNQLFFENLIYNRERNTEAAPLVTILRDSTTSPAERSKAESAFEAIRLRVEDRIDSILVTHQKSVLAAILGINKRLGIPDEVAINLKDQKARFKYYKEHFWDYIDLGNPVLLRLSVPLYKGKVDDYLDNLIYPQADSLILEIDKLITVSKASEATTQFLVWHLTTKYQISKILGYDKIFVHLVDRYFLSGEMDFFANDQLKSNLRERADQLRYSLVGMVAPNLVLQDMDEKPQALNDMQNEYTIIYFYDPDCGHCKKETPVVKSFVDSTQFDVGVYSVSADSSVTKNINYINEVGIQDWTNTNGTRTYGIQYLKRYDAYTTPTIYVLNRRKEIIAKKINASQLYEVLKKHSLSTQGTE